MSLTNQQIKETLKQIESEQNVTVLFACESGSRAWGFPSVDSDYDVRFVYCRPTLDYLKLQKIRDVIEKPICDLLDVSGWDLDKTLRLIRKSNPNILEWAESPIVYAENSNFQLLREVLKDSFDPHASTQHYLSMAMNNRKHWLLEPEVRVKKYLYTLRPLLCAQWVLEHQTQPPMLYMDLLNALYPNTRLNDEICELVRIKQDMNELDLVEANPFLNQWIEQKSNQLSEKLPDHIQPPEWSVYNQVFLDILEQVALDQTST